MAMAMAAVKVVKAEAVEAVSDVDLLHPEMKEKLDWYRKVWKQYDGDIKEDCECLVSGCLIDGESCLCALDLFNTVGDCKAEED